MTKGKSGVLPLSHSLDEAALLQCCRANYPDAWNMLMHRYEQPVYRFAYSLCHNREDANDITVQVFLKLYLNLHTFHCESSFTSWLFTIVRNTYRDMFARSAHKKPLSLDAILADCNESASGCVLFNQASSPEALYLEKETTEALATAIHYLPGYQRLVLRMYHSEGRSYEEIAEATGLPIGTIKSRLSRARNMLRQRLAICQDSLIAV